MGKRQQKPSRSRFHKKQRDAGWREEAPEYEEDPSVVKLPPEMVRKMMEELRKKRRL